MPTSVAVRKVLPLFIIIWTLVGRLVWAGPPEPVFPGEGWRHATDVRMFGWSPEKLAEARQVAAAIGSAAVMVVDRGTVIAAWGDIARKYRCHSMRKSLISALYGIATARGQIDLEANLAQLGIDDHPPALTDLEKKAAVGDLLASRSGVYHLALSESPEMKARRPARYSHPPGTFWYYNNWDFNALGTIYERATGSGVFDAFNAEIARPTGMQDFVPADGSYRSGPVSVHPAYRFRMSTRDLARFGLLFLRQGRWGQRRMLSPEWIETSTRAHSRVGPGRGYGYLWWTVAAGGRLPNVRLPEKAYYAAGYRGHRMFLFPGRDLMVVHRVNTDLPQRGPWSEGMAPTIDNHRIGRLLWKLLQAAGMQGIGPDPSWSAAPGERLEGSAIRELLLRKAIDMESGMRFAAYADGRCAIFRKGKVLEQGRWWVDADLFCSRWEGDPLGAPRRYRLTLAGDILRRYELDGTLAGEGRLADD
jgi:CubicO group peptidase (beta-lactamase class C family)